MALLCPDLLLGSRFEEAMRAGGHEVTRYDGDDMARAAASESDVLVVDLNADQYDGAVLVESMRMGRELDGVVALGFYAHLDQDARRRAEAAGFDVVVPRSRMAREASALIDRATGAGAR
ncbi:MAG: hypothetical protein JOZ25_01075 [Actinobacteria bacterium]|nr:hypothetical protein [Actinomycetota bacterium]